MNKLLAKPGHELLDMIEAGEIDHKELQQAQFKFARKADEKLNAFISWDEKIESHAWDLPIPKDGRKLFSRLPYAAKDIFATKGVCTTAGSKVLENYIPPYDASCVAHLRAEKNHLMGKTNLDEFAMGSSGELSSYNPTKNPWDFEYVPGGSSSGSAAAVAACQCVMALGTDTGGSVRQPASFCGVVGYRPSYGLVSRYGLVAYASSCDQAGVFARNSLDCALVMNTISQPDPFDSTCIAQQGVDYFGEAKREVHWEKLRVGVLKEFNNADGFEAGVLANFQASIEQLKSAGAEVVELDFPLVDYILPAYYIITAAECSSNLARYDGIRYGLKPTRDDLLERYFEVRGGGIGSEVKRRILLGTHVLSAGYFDAYYDRARHLRQDIYDSLMQMFRQVDFLATPTSPTPAFKLGERIDDPVSMYNSDLCTVFVNLVGTAGISLPNGFSEIDGAKLPTGIQFVCSPERDSLLLRFAHQFEQLTGWKYEQPEWVQDELGK